MSGEVRGIGIGRIFGRRRPATPTLGGLARAKDLPVMGFEQLVHVLGQVNRLREIRRLVSLAPADFDRYYLPVLRRFVEAAQLQPASEAHHHCHIGGLVVHTFEVLEYALKQRRGYMLPEHADAYTVRTEEHLWTYAVFVGALLHDAGKLLTLTRLCVTIAGEPVDWTPASRPLADLGIERYSIRFVGLDYPLQMRSSVVFLSTFVPPEGLDRLVQNDLVLEQLTAVLSNYPFDSGVLGRIVHSADETSIKRERHPGVPLEQLPSARVRSLPERMIGALRAEIHDGAAVLNRRNATGWVSGGFVYLVVGTVADVIRSRLKREGARDCPVDDGRIVDKLMEGGYLEDGEDGATWYVQLADGDDIRYMTTLKIDVNRLVSVRRRRGEWSGTVKEMDREAYYEARGQHDAGEGSDSPPPPANDFMARDDPPTPEPAPPDEDALAAVVDALGEPSPSADHRSSSRPSAPSGTTSRTRPSAQASGRSKSPSPPSSSRTPATTHADARSGPGSSSEAEGRSGPETPRSGAKAESAARKRAATKGGSSRAATRAAKAPSPSLTPLSLDDALAPTRDALRHEPVSLDDPALGRFFLTWVGDALEQRKLAVNERMSMVHGSAKGLVLVSPRIFKRFVVANHLLDPDKDGGVDEAMTVAQRAAFRTGLHLRNPAGSDLWTIRAFNADRPDLDPALPPGAKAVYRTLTVAIFPVGLFFDDPSKQAPDPNPHLDLDTPLRRGRSRRKSR